jgi:hypothetical protein
VKAQFDWVAHHEKGGDLNPAEKCGLEAIEPTDASSTSKGASSSQESVVGRVCVRSTMIASKRDAHVIRVCTCANAYHVLFALFFLTVTNRLTSYARPVLLPRHIRDA